ncbi:TadE/TadG family type IV pilus assembly protein [Delftia acidovorans]|uniref:TadE/TadG family type IV pilus assembly protein n=1 Tax=Delftia acidovorans TaxID=80866 RepID=UPI00359FC9DF
MRQSTSFRRPRQRGSAMVEFTVVGPIITLLGLALLQYGLVFFNKNQINHASFMAARAGTMAHARMDDIREAYLRAMVPLYGGGSNSDELADAKTKAKADLEGHLRIDLINPTRESFDDWSAPHLSRNTACEPFQTPAWRTGTKKDIGSKSAQSVQDANLLKIRVTHGYELKIPLVRGIYQHYLRWLDDGSDPFHTELIQHGRLPIVAQATLHMQSDAMESDATVSIPDKGDKGNPQDPGQPDTSEPGEPPDCETVGCTTVGPPRPGDEGEEDGDGDGGGDGGNEGDGDGNDKDCKGAECPSCEGKA